MKTVALRSLAALLGATVLSFPLVAYASSHREAPNITQMPKVDATDFYMFRSYESGRSGYVTFVAGYVPLQDAYGGPNYFSMDPKALYEIHIDNTGDAKEDLTFQFKFTHTLKDTALTIGGKTVSIPLANSGVISGVNHANLNVRETYSVNVVRGDRRTGTVAAVSNASTSATTFDKPVDYIGAKSIPDYAGYAAQHVYNINIPGCSGTGKMFVGQRKDPFVVNLGETFDLINIAKPATDFDSNAERLKADSLQYKNVTALVLEVPISCLTAGAETVIGAWTTASVRQSRLVNGAPTSGLGNASKEGGAWTQVSRLAMPLVNEVVIGVKDKDKFNASKPSADGQFADYVTNPTFPALVESLFSSAGVKAPTLFPRTDLVATFLTGVSGVNQPKSVTASEMLRLNTATPAVAKSAQNRLGVIGGDNAGFPNGRRPGDDVVDIVLRVAMGKLITLGLFGTSGKAATEAPSGGVGFTDGAYLDDSFFDAAFPYLKTPVAGSPQ